MTPSERETRTDPDLRIRNLREADLPRADRIMRVAFGTFLGMPDPAAFMGDADLVRTRWKASPSSAFAAEERGEIVGSNFAARWGSVGFFGPLTVEPERWGAGVGKRLMEPVMECFERWGTRHAGLFTFAHSPKHVGLYQRFGFWPRFLTAIMSREVGNARAGSWSLLSRLPAGDRESALAAGRALTSAIFDGLDVTGEIAAVADQELGDTVLLYDDSGLAAFAVCHAGAGSEAGSGTTYVKFGAVHPGARAEQAFVQLLAACNAFASERGSSRLVAGVSAGRHDAYRTLLAQGFRTDFQGVAMHLRNDSGYDRPGAFVLEDWR